MLYSNKDTGLKADEIIKNQKSFGKNIIKDNKKSNILLDFLSQFKDFMVITLLIAAIISFLISVFNKETDYLDPIIILVIVIFNSLLGVIQESRAQKALNAIKNITTPISKVLRDGRIIKIDSKELVPGDIILLDTGDYVPADGRLISSNSLKIDESNITGESIPTTKDCELIMPEQTIVSDRKNMVFAGSNVNHGKARAIVCSTGMDTEIGKIAHMISDEKQPDTPLQKKLAKTGAQLGIATILICLTIFIIGVLKNIEPFEMFMTSISLAVAAIPEGLPAIVTVMLAIGVQKMSGKNAIIKKLPAVETLGSATVICADKTGTLTQNKMKVVEIWDSHQILNKDKEQKKRHMLKLVSLCNNSYIDDENIIGDSTENALLIAAINNGISKKELDLKLSRIAEIPFDSERKLMTTIHFSNESGKYIIITKGAPDVLLKKCSHYEHKEQLMVLDNINKNKLNKINESMANRALRIIAVAYKETLDKPISANKDLEDNLCFLGFIGMIDPPREEVKEAIQICKMAGIKPIMITGDHALTATAIAKKIGLITQNDKIITGTELDKFSADDLVKHVNEYRVFARVTPEHKARIVRAFQDNEEVVAMTGDGVNDAPALKIADIGCSMGITGTDVAKEASDMVLTDDNFATIVEAVRQGRGIYSNVKKCIHFLLSSNIGEIICIFLSLVMGFVSPLLAMHLLWVNLVTDSLPAIAVGLEPIDPDIMNNPPVKKNAGLFSKHTWARITMEGFMIGLLSIIAFYIGHVIFDHHNGYLTARTMSFATLSISQLVHAFNLRSNKSIFSLNFYKNKYLIWAFCIGIILQTSVIMLPNIADIFKVTPLGPLAWTIVFILSSMPLLIIELQKNISVLIKNKREALSNNLQI